MKDETFLNRRAAVALGILLILLAGSCREGPLSTYLDPGGEDGAFQSQYTMMQVVGNFNGWNAGAPSMSLDETGVWSDTLTISAGCYLMKFRTNGAPREPDRHSQKLRQGEEEEHPPAGTTGSFSHGPGS